jgi:hypothetical protein
MAVLGIVFLVLVGIVVVAGVAMALMSLPDMRRYKRIRSM